MSLAQSPPVEEEQWSFHAQSTYIYQKKPAFAAPYSGPNSLTAESARDYSFTGTLFAGARLRPDGEGYSNLEFVQVVPIAPLTGFGGPSHRDRPQTRVPTLNRRRAR